MSILRRAVLIIEHRHEDTDNLAGLLEDKLADIPDVKVTASYTDVDAADAAEIEHLLNND